MIRRTSMTFHVNCDRIPGGIDALLARLDRWKPRSVLLMNAINLADPNNVVVRIKNKMAEWGAIVIYRPFENGEAWYWLNKTPQQHIAFLLSIGAANSGIWFSVMNEPVIDSEATARAFSAWCRDFIQLAVANNIDVVIPNFPTAAISRNVIDSGWLDELWSVIAQYRDAKENGIHRVIFGMHTYWLGHPVAAEGEGYSRLQDIDMLADPARWPDRRAIRIDIDDNFLVGRVYWFIRRMIEVIPGMTWDNIADYLTVAITEIGCDDIGDAEINAPAVYTWLRDNYTNNPTGFGKPAGYPTVWELYQEIGRRAGRDGAWAVGESWRWIQDTVYGEWLICAALYAMTTNNEGPDFWDAEYSLHHIPEALDYFPVVKAELEASWANDPPFPASLGAARAIRLAQAAANLRSTPAIANNRVGVIERDDLASIYPDTLTANDGFTWVVCDFGSLRAWIALMGDDYELQYVALTANSGSGLLTPEQLNALETKLEESKALAQQTFLSNRRTQLWLDNVTSSIQAMTTSRAVTDVYTLSLAGAANLRVRAAPGLSGAIAGQLQSGAIIHMSSDAPQNAGGYTWRSILQPVAGWIAVDAPGVTLAPRGDVDGFYIQVPLQEWFTERDEALKVAGLFRSFADTILSVVSNEERVMSKGFPLITHHF